jgi:hypothetical protein
MKTLPPKEEAEEEEEEEEVIIFFLFAVLGFEHRAYTLSQSTRPVFVIGFFKIESCDLFAWAGLEL